MFYRPLGHLCDPTCISMNIGAKMIKILIEHP